MNNNLFSPEMAHAVRQYMIEHNNINVDEAQRMSIAKLWDHVKEHGSDEDQQAVAHMVVERMTARSSNGHDVDFHDRQANIARADQEFGIVERYIEPGIPFEASFDLKPTDPSVAAAQNATMRWAARQSEPILILAGFPGVGKTHLAIAAANAIAHVPCDHVGPWQETGSTSKRTRDGDSDHVEMTVDYICPRCNGSGYEEGRPVVYRTEAALLAEIKGAISTNENDDLLNAFGTCSTLIIDDLGTEAKSDWTAAVMDNLVNQRWQMAEGGHRTLFTTNVKPGDLPPRMASRLGDRTRARQIEIKAPDYRQRSKQ